jgi:dipeptidyl aminopeptidase/acylaminoacyl peptidase
MLKPLLAASALALATCAALAQTAAPSPSLPGVDILGNKPLPIVDYLKPPQFSQVTLSPNGKYLAVATPIKGRLNLAVVDLDTRAATGLTSFDKFDVIDVSWASNDRLLFSLGQANSPTGPGQFDGGGFFVVSRDGKEFRKLAPTVLEMRNSGQQVPRHMRLLRRVPGNPDEVIVAANLRSSDAEDVYRLDLRNGRTSLVTDTRPERAADWILDDKLEPRVATSWVKDTLTFITYYRKDSKSPWQEVSRADRGKGTGIVVLGVMNDDKTLMVASNEGRDTMAVYKFDPETRKLGELLAQHPRYDMGADIQGDAVPGVLTEPDTDRVIGYQVNADRPLTVWTDEKEARTQAMLDKALPGLRNTFRRVPNSKRLLITSYSDVEPTRWYLLDEEKRTLEELLASRPWITKNHLVEMRPFLLKTRDGLEIPSYYFLPKGYKPGMRLPTVVHVHGGPMARADWWARGFGYFEAEILASRGYAVVLPNFRITPGFGAKIFASGFGTIGRQMSEDHEDAVKWAINEGFADPKRICMSGASYGGYATLRALAKTPELFKCGVAGLVVSDLDRQLTSTAGDTAFNPAGVTFWHKLVGVEANPNALKENSPVNMAKQIKAPLFMYAGADDIRTPLEQTTGMVRALEAAGNPPKTVLIKKEEGHGFGRFENNVDLYEKILKFLDEQIGSGAKPD